ncbi:MAG: PorV/PorQ family protein [Bacteroidota bacterium]
MNTRNIALYGLLLALTLAAVPAQAQRAESPEQSGTQGAEHLLIPLTARSAAMSNSLTSGLSNLNGIEALQSNPAGLMANTGSSALFSRMGYVADIGVNYFGVAQRVGNNNIALTITSWDFGDIDAIREDDPTPSSTYTATNIVVGATYARQLTDRIAAGVTAKFANETIDDMNAAYVAFDAGMTYTVGESGLRFGVSLKNLGPQMSFGGRGLARPIPVVDATDGIAGEIRAQSHELPSLLNFGVAYTRQFAEGIDATVIGNFRSNSYDPDQYAGALELGYQNIVFVRGGFELREDMDQTMYQGWNVGAGINYDFDGVGIAVDYAFRPVDFFSSVNLITAAVSL